MGTRGPIPRPGSHDSLRGRNTLKRTVKGRKASPVTMPASVKACKPAAAFWKTHAAALIEARRLRPELAHTFGLLCHLAADCERYVAELVEAGDVLMTARGPVANPVTKMLRDARRDYVALARDFGLTAASDARIPAEVEDGQEEDAEAAKFRRLVG